MQKKPAKKTDGMPNRRRRSSRRFARNQLPGNCLFFGSADAAEEDFEPDFLVFMHGKILQINEGIPRGCPHAVTIPLNINAST